ncbi:MAG: hypothetical protein JSR82_22990 [Verrucomicrobia bacterium]|nr:hypothetical protein [Verrucomicrobiota bacterium]
MPPPPTPPPAPKKDTRVAGLIELLQVMRGFTGAPTVSITPKAPELPTGEAGAAQLAVDAAASAVKIAHAVAALGGGGAAADQENATVIWQQTLEQIQRVQKLYGLPEMPFQAQTTPYPPTP